jgi:uncharacterized protein (UPF0335 family)
MAERASLSRKKSNGRARAGHNSGEVPREVVDRWWDKIVAGQAAVERATKPLKARKADLKGIYDAAKLDGVDVEALKDAIKADADDHLEVVTRYANTGKYLRAHKSPLGEQMNLFPLEPIPETMRAAIAGKRGGLRGGSVDENPYTPGSEPFVAYVEHWQKGQQELHEQLR